MSRSDLEGGGEKVAADLFRSYRARGHSSWLAVGQKHGDDPDVVPLPTAYYRGSWSRLWLSLEKRLQAPEGIAYSLTRTLLRTIANPAEELAPRFGAENFNHPGTYRLLELVPNMPDVVQCHNLHGGYFDLRVLPQLSQRVPVVLTLHDAWLLAGHCSHSFGCERWKSGCGRCPDLTLYPAVKRDATAYNWRRKRDIFTRSRIFVATPSERLMEKVRQSMLRGVMADTRVIPNGVDLNVFRPGDKFFSRAALNLPQDVAVLLFTAHRAQSNPWKDYDTLRTALERINQHTQRPMLLVCLGGDGATERIGAAELRPVPYVKDPKIVAQYYQAADIYVHASRIDTFPCTVLEALACGTPVIASEVGGIPEQIKGLQVLHSVAANRYGREEATGVLVPASNAEVMAESITGVLNDAPLRSELSQNAAKDARDRFDLELQAQRYLEWFEEIVGSVAVPSTSFAAAAV
ncbi:MAG TPA: glycosyltransferase [Gammaproteobacteria bacterium]|nr:glycosyltransferase [Gammaproteobacteria bacterium]